MARCLRAEAAPGCGVRGDPARPLAPRAGGRSGHLAHERRWCAARGVRSYMVSAGRPPVGPVGACGGGCRNVYHRRCRPLCRPAGVGPYQQSRRGKVVNPDASEGCDHEGWDAATARSRPGVTWSVRTAARARATAVTCEPNTDTAWVDHSFRKSGCRRSPERRGTGAPSLPLTVGTDDDTSTQSHIRSHVDGGSARCTLRSMRHLRAGVLTCVHGRFADPSHAELGVAVGGGDAPLPWELPDLPRRSRPGPAAGAAAALPKFRLLLR